PIGRLPPGTRWSRQKAPGRSTGRCPWTSGTRLPYPRRAVSMTAEKFRLVTRSDFDGLVCAVLLRYLDMIDEITFVHPKDVQDGAVDINERDILTNLPYAEAAHPVFDHHHSETLRVAGTPKNHIIEADAPSAARLIYDHYGGA